MWKLVPLMLLLLSLELYLYIYGAFVVEKLELLLTFVFFLPICVKM